MPYSIPALHTFELHRHTHARSIISGRRRRLAAAAAGDGLCAVARRRGGRRPLQRPHPELPVAGPGAAQRRHKRGRRRLCVHRAAGRCVGSGMHTESLLCGHAKLTRTSCLRHLNVPEWVRPGRPAGTRWVTVPLNDALCRLRRLSRPPACWRRCCRRASSPCGEAAKHGGSVVIVRIRERDVACPACPHPAQSEGWACCLIRAMSFA